MGVPTLSGNDRKGSVAVNAIHVPYLKLLLLGRTDNAEGINPQICHAFQALSRQFDSDTSVWQSYRDLDCIIWTKGGVLAPRNMGERGLERQRE